MRDLKATSFALTDCAAKLTECLQEEGFNVMWLKPARFSALHVLAYTSDAAGVHDIVSKRAFFQKILKMRPIHGVRNGLRQPGTNIRPITIADRLNEELSQRAAFELKLPEYIK